MTATITSTQRRGRGLVIFGAIILGLSVLITVAALIIVIVGVSTPESEQAMSMLLPFVLLFWLGFGAAPWYLGLILIALGRRQQRGPVRGEVLAWILGCAIYPVIGLQMDLLMASVGTSASLVLFFISIPVLIVLSWAGAALLIWGRPRKPQPA